MKMTERMIATVRWSAYVVVAPLALLLLAGAPSARADTMLLDATTLVSGSTADTFSFDVPTAGTVTAEITDLPWPVPLSSLSFTATTATSVLSTWSQSSSTSLPVFETFQVGPGTYFAHVSADAGGTLDLGLYSLSLTFTPAGAPVPLPDSIWLLLAGIAMLGVAGLLQVLVRAGVCEPTRNESVT